MFKKSFMFCVISLTLFYLCAEKIDAYEFINPKNENLVIEKINDIYDSKEQYEDLVGDYEETIVETHEATSDYYWWPIGSKETTMEGNVIFASGAPETITVTSPYGKRKDPFGGGTAKNHSGIDIAGGSGEGSVNIIAAKDGIVLIPNSTGGNCPSSNSQSNCGGGYGNHIIIQHSDGNFTLYAHLYEGSIMVKTGDIVKQGQVIGKMGSSGNSTGPHLHFEIRQGINASSSAIDPAKYINASNPRQSVQAISGDSNQQTACLTLKNRGYDDNAVVAILQNLYSESGINPINLQNSYEKSLGYTDKSYTEAVDSGKYKNFVNDKAGYGIAQWTFWTRKDKLYNHIKQQNKSIGDLGGQLEYFIKELEAYSGVNNYLLNASASFQDKTYKFCEGYEAPANTQKTCNSRATSAARFVEYVKNGCKDA